MILRWMVGGGKEAVLVDLGKIAFYFRLGKGEGRNFAPRAIRTLALVKAMKEAADKGMITAWS